MKQKITPDKKRKMTWINRRFPYTLFEFSATIVPVGIFKTVFRSRKEEIFIFAIVDGGYN